RRSPASARDRSPSRAEMLPDARAPSAATPGLPSHRPDGPDIDRSALAERDLLRPLDRLRLRIAFDQVEAAEDFLGLGDRAVGDLTLAGLEADTARAIVAPQALAVDHLLGRHELLAEALVALHHGLHLGLLRRRGVLVGIDEQHVAHTSSLCLEAGSGGGSTRAALYIRRRGRARSVAGRRGPGGIGPGPSAPRSGGGTRAGPPGSPGPAPRRWCTTPPTPWGGRTRSPAVTAPSWPARCRICGPSTAWPIWSR